MKRFRKELVTVKAPWVKTSGMKAFNNAPTFEGFWRSWIFNIESNKGTFKSVEPLKSIYDTKQGKTCLVVGAGPSLHENIQEIKKAQSAGVEILAVDRAFIPLKENGIKPTATISADAQETVLDYFPDDLVEEDDLFFASMLLHPKVIERMSKGNILGYLPYYPTIKETNEVYKKIVEPVFGKRFYNIRPGAIVTYSALDAAYFMGYNVVGIIGNDLCWRDPHQTKVSTRSGQVIKINIPSGDVYTITAFIQCANQFSIWIENEYKDNCRFVDCSGGIMLNVEKMELKNFIQQYQEAKDEKILDYFKLIRHDRVWNPQGNLSATVLRAGNDGGSGVDEVRCESVA